MGIFRVGAPQVVLPQWLDTYDCATRVEWLGIGLNGSRTAAPGVEAREFSKVLLDVLADEEIRTRAATVKNLCKGEGRIEAHDRIVEFCLN
jgi:UDP:flavonoid glycosyltransferase YjiC (YdhE family)